MHFVIPREYEVTIPPAFPARRELVLVSGAAELAGAAAVLHPRTRRWAGRYLVGLLLAVYPANVYMATNYDDIKGIRGPRWIYWARLPLQFALIKWALDGTRPSRRM